MGHRGDWWVVLGGERQQRRTHHCQGRSSAPGSQVFRRQPGVRAPAGPLHRALALFLLLRYTSEICCLRRREHGGQGSVWAASAGGGEGGGVQRGESLACSSLFFCCRLAFSTWSWLFVFMRMALASRLSCRRAFASASCCSIESVAAFFLSRAVWAATRFFSFLLIIRSSGLRWSKLALFLAGAS